MMPSPDSGVPDELPERPTPGSTERPIRTGGRVARALSWWVDRVRRRAAFVLILAVLATVGGGFYAPGHLSMNTDMTAMLSSDLPHRKAIDAFQGVFPELEDNIVIVIDGETPDQAEDAALALSERLEERTDLLNTVFYPAGLPFFRRNGLLFLDLDELQRLADRLADAQPLLSKLAGDMSLRGMFDLLGDAADEVAKGDTEPQPLVRVFDLIGDSVEAFVEGHPRRLSWRDLMAPEPLEPSDYRALIAVQPRPDYTSLTPAKAAMDAIRRTAAELDLNPAHGVTLRLTGSLPIRSEELRSVREGAGLAGVISLVLVTFLVFFGLRSPKLVLATVATLVMGLVWTAAFAAIAIGRLNLMSVAFAVLFIGLAVDFSIQFGLRYMECINTGERHGQALRVAIGGSGTAIGLAALCAAIGFFSFIPTSYVGLSELGVIAGVGMFIGAFGALTVLPALLTVLSPQPRPPGAAQSMSAASFGGFIERHARGMCLGALAVGVAAVAALPLARFNFDPISLRDPSTESVRAYLDLARSSENSPYRINVLTPSLEAGVGLGDRLEKLPVVDKAVTLRSFVPKNQEQKLAVVDGMALFLTPILEFTERKPPPTAAERRAALARFRDRLHDMIGSPNAGPLTGPAQRLVDLLDRFTAERGENQAAYSGLETALLANLPGRLETLRETMKAGPVSLGDLPGVLRDRYVSDDGRARLEVLPAQPLRTEKAMRRFVDEVRRIAPNATDTPVLIIEGGDTVIEAFKQAAVIAFVAITLVLVVVLRSVGDTLLVLSPLILAALLTVAIMVVTGVEFNFANVIALPLLFSLGVAFGIYLVLRHRETGDVPHVLATSTPRAVLFSALTTMASFGSLMVSSHRGTASMGELLVISLVLALACTLIVLPALLAWRQQRQTARPALVPSSGKD